MIWRLTSPLSSFKHWQQAHHGSAAFSFIPPQRTRTLYLPFEYGHSGNRKHMFPHVQQNHIAPAVSADKEKSFYGLG